MNITKRFSVSTCICLYYGVFLTLIPSESYAQNNAPPPTAGVDVELSFVTTYIDRGSDLLSDYNAQKHHSHDAFNHPGAFQPGIVWHTPIEGFYIEIWGSFALSGRDDVDVDGVLQQQPGGKDLLRNAHSPDEQVSAILTATGVSGTDPLEPINGLNNYAYPGCIENNSCLPGYYKEQVGLKRSDRFIPTIGYERETDIGVLVAGITSDSPANTINKETPTNEIFVGYALPFLPSLLLEAYVDMDTADDYFMLTYANEIELTDWMSLEYDLHLGYAVQSHLQGVQDVTAHLRYNVYGFFMGVTCAYRPDLRFHEGDKTAGSDHLPFWLLGQSSRGDGLVTDPARTYGLAEQYINSVIDDFLRGTSGLSAYQFTPRQKLLPVIWAANIGYAFSI